MICSNKLRKKRKRKENREERKKERADEEEEEEERQRKNNKSQEIPPLRRDVANVRWAGHLEKMNGSFVEKVALRAKR